MAPVIETPRSGVQIRSAFHAEVEMSDSKLIFSRHFTCGRRDCKHHDTCSAHIDKHVSSPASFKPVFRSYHDSFGKVSIYCTNWTLETDEAKRSKRYPISKALYPPGSITISRHRIIKGSTYDVPSDGNGGRSGGGNGSS